MNSVVVGTLLIITLGRGVSSGRLTPDESIPVRKYGAPDPHVHAGAPLLRPRSW